MDKNKFINKNKKTFIKYLISLKFNKDNNFFQENL
jgi:hypothetical protein